MILQILVKSENNTTLKTTDIIGETISMTP